MFLSKKSKYTIFLMSGLFLFFDTTKPICDLIKHHAQKEFKNRFRYNTLEEIYEESMHAKYLAGVGSIASLATISGLIYVIKKIYQSYKQKINNKVLNNWKKVGYLSGITLLSLITACATLLGFITTGGIFMSAEMQKIAQKTLKDRNKEKL